MAVKYSSANTVWPRNMLELYNDVLTRDGLHYTIKAGRTWYSRNRNEQPKGQPSKVNHLVKPFYIGYCLRFFLFAAELKGESYVGVYRADKITTWKGRVHVHDADVSTIEHSKPPLSVGTVQLGDIYTSSFIVVNKELFWMSFNEIGLRNLDMKDISDKYDFDLWMDNGRHATLSMHFYNSFSDPTPQLRDPLYLEHFSVPPGSYATYVVEYAGNAEAVTVHVRMEVPPNLQFTFANNGRVRKKQTFHCIVRITTYGYAVSTSFDPTPQFQPAGSSIDRLQCHFSYGSIKNAHIVAPR